MTSQMMNLRDKKEMIGYHPSHYQVLKNGKWLTDSLIDAAQTLLKEAYPHVASLQTVTKGEVLSFDVVHTDEFVQILNGTPWITVSTIGCTPGVVNVFDSLPNIDVPKRIKEQIASILCTPKKKFTCSKRTNTSWGR